jgi:hypothetical protein
VLTELKCFKRSKRFDAFERSFFNLKKRIMKVKFIGAGTVTGSKH